MVRSKLVKLDLIGWSFCNEQLMLSKLKHCSINLMSQSWIRIKKYEKGDKIICWIQLDMIGLSKHEICLVERELLQVIIHAVYCLMLQGHDYCGSK